MNTPTATLHRAFLHPLLIGSILLLLINDHLLKVYNPSWLTGKLSDFAGLFFFPFLLALILRRPVRDEDRALRCGLLLTGLVFGAIKTLPAANDALTGAVRLVLGPSVQFVLDPSDLLALVMLLAAWLFWQRLRAQSEPAQPGRLAYAMMALGSLAALATSPCPYANRVERVVAVEGKVYAGINYPWRMNAPWISVLSDDQKTWNYVEVPSDRVLAAFAEPAPEPPAALCDPTAPLICYQIDAQARILESRDGGQTWAASWQYPPGREDYMDRAGIEGACGQAPDRRFYELALLPGPQGTTVVAAAGNQGVLVRKGSEPWQRMGVETRSGPTPTASTSIDHAFGMIAIEFIIAGAASLLAYTILSLLARDYTPIGEDGKRHHPAWALHPALFVLSWLLAGPALWLSYPDNSFVLPSVQFFASIALIFMLLTLVLTTTGENGVRRKTGLLVMSAVFAVLALPVSIFLLWAFGAITHYQTALILALVITPLVFGWLVYQIRRELMSLV